MRRRLDAEIVRRGLAPSRTRAAELIDLGRVRVGGAPADKAARMVGPGEAIVVEGDPARFASRGGEKLDAALARWPVEVAGRRWLDAGASTGGFTDCLLQRGAAAVVAVDVGRGQLAWALRTDPRVEVHEGVNVRALTPDDVGGTTGGAVVDVSFISLLAVAPALHRVVEPGGPVVALVKPQFEAGPARVGKGGVVRDPEVHADVLRTVGAGLGPVGFDVRAVMASPLRGPAGNVEFLAHLRRRPDGAPAGGLAGDQLDAAVAVALAEAPPP